MLLANNLETNWLSIVSVSPNEQAKFDVTCSLSLGRSLSHSPSLSFLSSIQFYLSCMYEKCMFLCAVRFEKGLTIQLCTQNKPNSIRKFCSAFEHHETFLLLLLLLESTQELCIALHVLFIVLIINKVFCMNSIQNVITSTCFALCAWVCVCRCRYSKEYSVACMHVCMCMCVCEYSSIMMYRKVIKYVRIILKTLKFRLIKDVWSNI